METSNVNRRKFVGTVGLAAASIATGALLPDWTTKGQMAPYAKTGPLTDWSIDDITGAAPRYAEAIGHPQFDTVAIADSNPLDCLFMV